MEYLLKEVERQNDSLLRTFVQIFHDLNTVKSVIAEYYSRLNKEWEIADSLCELMLEEKPEDIIAMLDDAIDFWDLQTTWLKQVVIDFGLLIPKVKMTRELFLKEASRVTNGTNPLRRLRPLKSSEEEKKRADSSNGIGDPGSLYEFLRFYKIVVSPGYHKSLKSFEARLNRYKINKQVKLSN